MDALDPIVVELGERLENPGDSLPVSGRIEIGSYSTGEKELAPPDGVSYDVVLTHAGDGILATGIVRAHAQASCDRCLEPEDADAYEDGFELVGPDRTVDLSGPIWDAMVMDTPFVILCRPDCAGLCPTCGANLNEGPCGCAERAERERLEGDDNPFAVLRGLDLGE